MANILTRTRSARSTLLTCFCRCSSSAIVPSEQPEFGRWRAYYCLDPTDALRVRVVEKKHFKAWIDSQSSAMQKWVAINGLSKFQDSALLLLHGDPDDHSALFFADDAADLYTFSSLPSRLNASGVSAVRLEMVMGGPLPAAAFFSWCLGCYKFENYKRQVSEQAFARLQWTESMDNTAASHALDATFLVRDLVNTPTEHLGPADLEAAVRFIGDQYGARVESIVGNELLDMNYPQIHAVGRAAAPGREPRLVDLRWGNTEAPKVTLVGKGVCYDTGGLSIKPTSGMLTMKKDMAGAAQVLGLAQMIMAAKLNVRLRVLIPAVENDVAGGCFRPGDVLRARNGQTTEVMNTDAEGRLILADALVEACSEMPSLLVDCATLTGARTVALGLDIPVLLCNPEAASFAAELQVLSGLEQDQVWQLPLWQPYRSALKSPIADVRNVGGEAGAIIAGLYLQEFVRGPGDGPSPPWLHLDLSAWRGKSSPGRPEGGDAMGMRALYRLIEARFGEPSAAVA